MIKKYHLMLAATLLSSVICSSAVQAKPKPKASVGKMPASLPVAHYVNFARSNTTASLSPKHPEYKSFDEVGGPLDLLGQGEGWALVRSVIVDTTLKVPLGWFAIDTMSGAQIYSPDYDTTILLRLLDEPPPASAPAPRPKTAAQFFANARALTNELADEMTLPQSTRRVGTLADGSYAVEVLRPRTIRGDEKKSSPRAILQVITPNPVAPRFPMLLVLNSSLKDYPRNLKLVGLVLRDRKVDWQKDEIS